MAAAAARRAMAAHIYVSEGRDAALIARLGRIGVAAGAILANEFLDVAYHRSGITLAATDDSAIEHGVVAVCREAFAVLDLRKHVATHPRVGVVDHVACNPIGAATSAEAGVLAARIARRLGHTDEGETAVPVYLYGAARGDGRPLAELRRSLGYFSGARQGEWSGLSEEMAAALRGLAPDFGVAGDVDPRLGALVVGAIPWVCNYNLLVVAGTGSGDLMACCRRIARSVSTRGGGLPAVETMALPHEQGVEVACNLLDVSVTSAEQVKARVLELCAGEGVTLKGDYFTNKNPEDILEMVATQAPSQEDD